MAAGPAASLFDKLAGTRAQKESMTMATQNKLPKLTSNEGSVSWGVIDGFLVIATPLDEGESWEEPSEKAAVRDDGKSKNMVKTSRGFRVAGHGQTRFSLNVIRPREECENL